MDNCGYVVGAIDERLAGDLAARADPHGPGYGGSAQSTAIRQTVAVGDNLDVVFDPATQETISQELASRGDRARGVVRVEWLLPDGSLANHGHVFNVIRQNGVVFYLDGQTGRVEQTIAALYPDETATNIEYAPMTGQRDAPPLP